MVFSLIYAMCFAFAVSLAVSGFMIQAGVGDIPNARSNHTGTVPTSGGVGIAAGFAGMFLILPHFFQPEVLSPEWPFLLSLLGIVAVLGLLDDIFMLPSLLKFVLLMGLASLAVWIIGPVLIIPYAKSGFEIPYWAGFLGSVLWIFVVANAVNFMDGSNGLMACVMIVACGGLVFISGRLGATEAVLIPAGLAAGLLGYLPYNMRRGARIFSGDVGSLLVGFGFAVAVLWLAAEKPQAFPVFFGPILILPFLTDVLLTMLRRAMQKENLLAAHKGHLYQRLITAGHSNICVALYYSLAGLVLAAYAYYMASRGFHTFTVFLSFPVLVLSGIYYFMLLRLKRLSKAKRSEAD